MSSITQYLQKLGLDGKSDISPTLSFLKEISHKHLLTFRYQNSLLFLEGNKPIVNRKVPSLSMDVLFEQFVLKNQPGYCFQSIEVLAWALHALGFEFTRHLAIVINTNSDKVNDEKVKSEPFSHEVLLVKINGVVWLVDPGFANNSLREPLAISAEEQRIAEDVYRMQTLNQYLRLETKTKDGWLSLYQIDCTPKTIDDIEEAHRQLFLTPQSIVIRDGLLKFGLVSDTKRKVLVGFKDGRMAFFKSYKNGQLYKERSIYSEEEYKRHAKDKFFVEMSEDLVQCCIFNDRVLS